MLVWIARCSTSDLVQSFYQSSPTKSSRPRSYLADCPEILPQLPRYFPLSSLFGRQLHVQVSPASDDPSHRRVSTNLTNHYEACFREFTGACGTLHLTARIHDSLSLIAIDVCMAKQRSDRRHYSYRSLAVHPSRISSKGLRAQGSAPPYPAAV